MNTGLQQFGPAILYVEVFVPFGNCFGGHWSYLQFSGLLWILIGLAVLWPFNANQKVFSTAEENTNPGVTPAPALKVLQA